MLLIPAIRTAAVTPSLAHQLAHDSHYVVSFLITMTTSCHYYAVMVGLEEPDTDSLGSMRLLRTLPLPIYFSNSESTMACRDTTRRLYFW